MIVKIHKRNNRTIVAICDDDLLGKVFEQDQKILDLSSSFYAGEPVTVEQATEVACIADIINLVGKDSVQIGLDVGVISKGVVQMIADIPYAQAVVEL